MSMLVFQKTVCPWNIILNGVGQGRIIAGWETAVKEKKKNVCVPTQKVTDNVLSKKAL